MDIHPPHGPIHSIKDFSLQLLTITVGILIALSLEGLLEWRHHRAMVRAAESNISREIRDNKQILDNALQQAHQVEESQQQALHLVNDLLAHKKSNIHKLNLSYGIVQLSAASWETAQATAATGYMEYGQVEKYAEIYDLQRRLDMVLGQLLDSFITLTVQDPSAASEAELRDLKQHIVRTLSYLHAAESIAKGLSDDYGRALAKH